MLFRTHVAFGMFIYLLFFSYFENPIVTLAGFLIGIIIVDIDSKKSKIGKHWYFRPIQWFTKHRKFFHSFLFGLIGTGTLAILNIELAFGFLVGFLTHILLDSQTIKGVTPFHPFANVKVKGIIRTNGITETILFVTLLLLDLLLVVINLIILAK
jgi:inner membrane protein